MHPQKLFPYRYYLRYHFSLCLHITNLKDLIMTERPKMPPTLSLTPQEVNAVRPDNQHAPLDPKITGCGNWQIYSPEEARRRLERRGSWTVPNLPILSSR